MHKKKNENTLEINAWVFMKLHKKVVQYIQMCSVKDNQ